MKLDLRCVLAALVVVCSPAMMRAQASLGVRLDSNATVVAVHPGSAAEKAGLKPGDVITGLNNQALTGGTSEIEATMAKTRPGSLLPVTIRRAGHPQTLLAFPTAAAGGAGGGGSVGALPLTGHYNCVTFTFTAGMLAQAPSSLMTGIDLLPGGAYRTLKEQGRFHADSGSDRLVFEGGPLAKSVAHLQRDTNGKPKIQFVQSENRTAMDGHEIDHGPTACYLK